MHAVGERGVSSFLCRNRELDSNFFEHPYGKSETGENFIALHRVGASYHPFSDCAR